MRFQLAFLIAFAQRFTCDEVALLQTAKAVRTRSRHTSRNLSAHVADPGIPCPTMQGWQVVTLPASSIGVGSYCLPPSTAYDDLQTALLAGNVYEESTHDALETYLANASPGDFIHGGAFIGDFLPQLSKLASTGSRVYAFEPEPLYMNATRGTIGESALTNVFTVEAGMSNESAVVELSVQGSSSRADFLCVPIDDVIEADRPVSLIFVDVEGYELLALQGAARTLQNFHPIVIAAILKQSGHNADLEVDDTEVERYLSGFGYEKFHVSDDNVFFRAQ